MGFPWEKMVKLLLYALFAFTPICIDRYNIYLCIFQLASLPLKELYCEANPLLQHIPVHSVQEEEVLSLKVLFIPFHRCFLVQAHLSIG